MKRKVKKIIFYASWFLRYSFLTLFFLIISLPLRFSKKYKNLWLISERPDEARDNGYWLYKWIVENKPETNVRYILSKNSTDYEKMPHKELIIEPGSAKHYITHILSSYSISTHMHGACPGKSFCIPFLLFMRRKKTIFLQHGIIQNKLKLRGGLDAIIASTESEKNLMISANPKYKDKIHIVGLCRYDQLIDESKNHKRKTILVMPTFRKWLRDISRLKNADKEFIKTEYYKKWNSFLKSKELEEITTKDNLRVIFFPHKEMQQLAQNIKPSNKNIEVGRPGQYDIQKLLKESSILVTDYSSVFFDFIYMKKPVIFYQFDQNEFFSKHYASSGKDYPFGDIIKNENDLISKINGIIKNDFNMKDKYRQESDEFYKYHDNKYCERNYYLIREL